MELRLYSVGGIVVIDGRAYAYASSAYAYNLNEAEKAAYLKATKLNPNAKIELVLAETPVLCYLEDNVVYFEGKVELNNAVSNSSDS